MTRVLILQESVSPVRIPIYNEVARHCELTMVYSGKFPEGAIFPNIKMEKISILYYKHYKKSIGRLAKQFDVLIAPMSYVQIETVRMLLIRRPCKIILWGIGVPASYTVRFDDPQAKNKIPWLIKKADAVLFYSDYPVQKYSKLGMNSQNMFVANNTVPVNNMPFDRPRSSILFIGSLYPQKKVMELLEAYHRVLREHPAIPRLDIIGDGSEHDRMQTYIRDNGLEERVNMTGAIYDDNALEPYFMSAYACISPDQAGLSVLKAMGYGVPFVTTENAFSGGERLNIINNANGILMSDLGELDGVLLDILYNQEKYVRMGRRGYDFYWNYRRPDQMAAGFLNAIDYVVSHTDREKD